MVSVYVHKFINAMSLCVELGLRCIYVHTFVYLYMVWYCSLKPTSYAVIYWDLLMSNRLRSRQLQSETEGKIVWQHDSLPKQS